MILKWREWNYTQSSSDLCQGCSYWEKATKKCPFPADYAPKAAKCRTTINEHGKGEEANETD